MTAVEIMRKDFEDALRSRMIWGAIAVFVLLLGIFAMSTAAGGVSDTEPIDVIPLFSTLGGVMLIPIVALMVGYMSIVGERNSGSLRILFGLSQSRSDVFGGKFASRLAVITIATLTTCATGIGLSLLLFDSLPWETFVGFFGLTVLLGVAFTAIAVGVSALSDSRPKAMGGAIGTYVMFIIFWHPLVAGVHYLVNGEFAGIEAADWYLFLLRLNPLHVYVETASSFSDQYIPLFLNWPATLADVPDGTRITGETFMLSNRVSGEVPFFLSEWFAPVTMLVWIVLPAAVGYWAFERADLN